MNTLVTCNWSRPNHTSNGSPLMNTSQTNLLARLYQSWPILGFALACLLIAQGVAGRFPITSRAEAAATTPQPGPRTHSFRPIEQIRVGQRVITDLPEGILDIDGQPFNESPPEGATRVDPATWRLVRMRAEEVWPDGTVDDINIETLQPQEWIEAHHVHIGGRAPIPLDLVEMGLPEELQGEVLAIEPCPAIEAGPGRVVLTTVNHLHPSVLDLTIKNGHGDQEIVRPTTNHRFYSLDRHAWTTAGELQTGERLRALSGDLAVVSLTPLRGVHTVYNLTVEHEHVYHVSSLAVEAHNNCPPLTGQVHHPVSRPIRDALNRDPNLAGPWSRDPQLTTQAIDRAAHNGYEQWHRDLDRLVVGEIESGRFQTSEEFLRWLRERYMNDPDLASKFPGGF